MPVTSRRPRRAPGAAGVAGAVLAVATPVALALLLGGCGTAAQASAPGPKAPAGDGRLVLVSGRDDHGEVAQTSVALSRDVEGVETVASVPDGTLARVVATDGQWQEVESLDGPAVRGWVDDFHLRGVVHLLGPAPSCAPVLNGRRLAPGTQATVRAVRADGHVQVRTLGSTPLTGWLPRAGVRELPPVGPHCGDGTDPRTDGHAAGHHH